MSTRVIGIDPGGTGSLCLLDSKLPTIEFFATPGDLVSPLTLLQWIEARHEEKAVRIIGIEDVHSIHGMSAKSNFSFGYNCGMVYAIASCSGIGVDFVKPKVWQKRVGVPPLQKLSGPAKKKKIASRALQLYPQIQSQIMGPRGGLIDGRSDALLIAHFFAQQYP